ncbi:zinc finger MYM-type protein 1-like [Branchiostoma floridae x Branchiostoma japonicum]
MAPKRKAAPERKTSRKKPTIPSIESFFARVPQQENNNNNADDSRRGELQNKSSDTETTVTTQMTSAETEKAPTTATTQMTSAETEKAPTTATTQMTSAETEKAPTTATTQMTSAETEKAPTTATTQMTSAETEKAPTTATTQMTSAETEKAPTTATTQMTSEDTETETPTSANCDCKGCTMKGPTAFQPKDPAVLGTFQNKGRKFLSSWYTDRGWVTLCTQRRKVFCATCRYATQRKLFALSTKVEPAFVTTGFDNYKKAIDKFDTHAESDAHKEAAMKCSAVSGPSISSHINSQITGQQQLHRDGLLKQLTALRYLLRQGLAVRGHLDKDGNLYHLLQTWAADSDVVRSWLQQGRFMSHDTINELITLMGHNVLRSVLERINGNDPAWFAIIADEATDVACNEQLNISIRYVDSNYEVHEDSLGLYQLPSTNAATITNAIKDTLLRTGIPLKLCRGQAYDGAANMQGHRSGVATRIRSEEPAAVPVHCWAHSLNLCLQDVCRQIVSIRDAIDIAKEIDRLINYSPKRKTLFHQLAASGDNDSSGTVKPLCPTRWTVRTEALDSILSNYGTIMDTMHEVNLTTRDDYGLKAGGVLTALEKFDTLFAVRFGHRLFSAAEEVSKTLQKKDLSVQEAVSSVNALKEHYGRLRTDEAFDTFYSATVETARGLNIGEPALPRYRRQPRRLDEGSDPHRHATPKDFYRQVFFQACDLLIGELSQRFDQDFLKPVVAMEKVLLEAANGNDFSGHMDEVMSSVFANDLDQRKLTIHLSMLPDIVKQELPDVKKVTSIRTICSAMSAGSHRTTFSQTHKLLRLYLTIPITSSTSERAFSSLKRLLTYLRSSMTEQRLNNCMLLHVHKDIVDTMDLNAIVTDFVSLNEERMRYFGK